VAYAAVKYSALVQDGRLLGLKPKPQPVKEPTVAATGTKPAATATPPAKATHRVVPRNDGRFNVVGPRGALTTRSTVEAAEAYIEGLSQTTQPRKEQPAPTRSSSRCRGKPADPSPKPETRGREAGAAWHGRRKEPDAVLPEDALQDYLNSNPLAKRSKHGELSAACTRELKQLRTEHTEQQKKYDKARALLAAELGYETNEPLRRSEIAELVGTGHDDLKGRTIRRYKQNVVAEIRLQVLWLLLAAKIVKLVRLNLKPNKNESKAYKQGINLLCMSDKFNHYAWHFGGLRPPTLLIQC
jgi:hypothetical protein